MSKPIVKSPFDEDAGEDAGSYGKGGVLFQPARGKSEWDGAHYAGGDIKVSGSDVVIGGPQVGDEDGALFDVLGGMGGRK